MPDMAEGTVLGHEAVGVVEEVGDSVRGFTPGDRVVVTSTIGCGTCSYCRAGYFAQCDTANPNGPAAGTCFFGGPKSTGPVNGLQAERARIPHAMTTLVRVPDGVSDDQAILLSDIFPTAWFGSKLAEVGDGDAVLVLGAGVVGQFAIASAQRQGAGRVIVVDGVESRLDKARGQNAETVNFNEEDPVEVVKDLTGGIGPDRVIEAVGVDAERPGERSGEQWKPGDAPRQALDWAVELVAKAGSIGVIGVYPPGFDDFPIGQAMNKNLTVRMGNCNHRRYLPKLLDLVLTGSVDPMAFITQHEKPTSAVDAYKSFDLREDGWLKTVLDVA
ncbi:MAG TPA: alcohol dehydrogenase catalytic domain-containing protein, partial [Lentzea sp.]